MLCWLIQSPSMGFPNFGYDLILTNNMLGSGTFVWSGLRLGSEVLFRFKMLLDYQRCIWIFDNYISNKIKRYKIKRNKWFSMESHQINLKKTGGEELVICNRSLIMSSCTLYLTINMWNDALLINVTKN